MDKKVGRSPELDEAMVRMAIAVMSLGNIIKMETKKDISAQPIGDGAKKYITDIVDNIVNMYDKTFGMGLLEQDKVLMKLAAKIIEETKKEDKKS